MGLRRRIGFDTDQAAEQEALDITEQTACFPHPTQPLFDAIVEEEPSNFCIKLPVIRKTRGMGLLYGENCIIETSAVSTDPPM